ncbi:MAG: AMIN-like domain-containing (lipo)protein [Pseudonocardiaceae bacterium]
MALGTLVFCAAATAATAAAAVPGQSAVASAGVGELTGIRTGVHSGYDRIVLDYPGGAPQVTRSQFVPRLIRDGSGEVEPLPGAAFAEVGMFPARTTDAQANPTYPGPRKFTTPGLSNVTAIAIIGDYEGHLTIGMGMHRRMSLHVFTLTGPPRIVVDIAR